MLEEGLYRIYAQLLNSLFMSAIFFHCSFLFDDVSWSFILWSWLGFVYKLDKMVLLTGVSWNRVWISWKMKGRINLYIFFGIYHTKLPNYAFYQCLNTFICLTTFLIPAYLNCSEAPYICLFLAWMSSFLSKSD